MSEASFAETTIVPPLQDGRLGLAILGARRARLPNRLMLSSYVKPMKWDYPSANTSTLGLDTAWEIIDR